MGKYILELNNIHKSFGSKKVIKGVNLEVLPQDVFGFLGPNGAGKTTIIRIILGLIYPSQGEIFIDGYNIHNDFNKAIANVGAVVETPKFYPYLSGYQNLLLVANLHKNLPKNRILEVLELVGLTDRAEDKAGTYSLGMKQRLGIARALINDPKLIFLDEPMNGLDPQGMFEIRQLIKSLAEEKGISFFITSHLLNEIEQVCNKIAILKDGQIVTQGKISQLLSKDTESIEIHTNRATEAVNILTGFTYVKNLKQVNDKVLAEIEQGRSSELNRFLITQSIDVKYIVPKNQSLEDFFVNLTEGEN